MCPRCSPSMTTIGPHSGSPARKVRRFRGESVRVASIWLAVIAVISLSAAARAATVTVAQGQVLVNSGQGYRLVNGSAQLEPGATVVANPGAIAEVAYPGGCTVTVQPGSVYVIASQAPCQKGEPVQSGGLTGGLTDKSAPSGESGSGGSGTAWAIGGAALVAGGAAAYFLIPPLSP
jgi:hypothetical protein